MAFSLVNQGFVRRLRNKKATRRVAFGKAYKHQLLEFDFFVLNVFASFGVKLHKSQLLGRGFFVFAGGIKMAGTCSRFQLDFFASAF
jgi:hypothetical protein